MVLVAVGDLIVRIEPIREDVPVHDDRVLVVLRFDDADGKRPFSW